MDKHALTVSARKILAGAFIVAIQAFGLAYGNDKFPIVDSGSWVIGRDKAIYWLDDRRVLFIGHDLVVPMSDREPKLALLQWDVGKATKIVRRGVEWLCYRPGQIAYSVRDEQSKARIFFQGALGKELRVEARNPDTMNCDVTYGPPDKSENKDVKQLLRGHGYLYLGPAFGKESSENTSVFLVREGETRKVQLPFGRRELSVVEYYEFRKAYFVQLNYFDSSKGIGPTTTWPPGTAQKAYWLLPDGKTEQVKLPGDISGPIPSRAGIAFRVFGTNTAKDGIYLVTPKLLRAVVLRGYVTQTVLSPDGCWLAFSHAPDRESDAWRPKNRRTLKAANLCSGAKE